MSTVNKNCWSAGENWPFLSSYLSTSHPPFSVHVPVKFLSTHGPNRQQLYTAILLCALKIALSVSRSSVEPGWSASISHGSKSLRKSSELYCERMAFGVCVFHLIVLLSVMWLRRRRAARRHLRRLWTWLGKHVTAVTEQRVRGFGCFFSSPSRDGCLLRICSEELYGWGTGAVHFGTNCWELEWEWNAIDYTLITHFHTS